jgi:predicted amidohydrolase YtcJ
MKRMLVAAWLLLVPGSASFAQAPGAASTPGDLPPEVVAYPQLVLFNGHILTVDERFSVAQALAVRDDRILAVGDNARILRMAGPATRKIDLAGKTVVPGLIDTHYHLGDYVIRHMLLDERAVEWEGKVELLGVLWRDREMALRDLARAVKAAPAGELVRVPGRNPGVLQGVTLKELDTLAPDHPLVVVSASGLSPAFVNTRALRLVEAAGTATPATPGWPAGGTAAIGGRASQLMANYLTWAVPLEKVLPWHQRIMTLANSWGLTAVVTRIAPDQFNAVRELWLQDRLSMRWRVSFPGPIDVPRTGNVSDIGDDWLRISGGGSLTVGGPVLGHWTSKRPLTDLPAAEDQEGASSIERWPQARRAILEILRYGWSVPNSHVKGDVATSAVLDVIEEARRNPIAKSSNQRLTLDHVPDVREEDIERMRQLGIVPSSTLRDLFQDDTAEGSSRFQAVFGADHVERMIPLKKYVDAGMRPTIEADMGDEALGRPLWTVEKAVCRCVDGSTRVWGQDQRVSREDALRMKTIWAARYVGDQRKLGSLEAGKLADLVVLDRDYMTVPEREISDLQVLLTVVGGRVVYEKE